MPVIIEYPEIRDGTQALITCPQCEEGLRPKVVNLIVRTNGSTGKRFIGCPNWPDCKHTQPLPQAIIMRLRGQPTLF